MRVVGRFVVGLVAGCAAGADVPLPDTDATADTGTGADPCLAEPAVLRIGWGDYEYQPLVDGQDVPVTRGNQAPGGIWHFPVAFEAENVTRYANTRWRVLRASDGAPLLQEDPFVWNVALRASDGSGNWACEGQTWGGAAVLDPVAAGWPNDTDPDRWRVFCGLPVRIELEVRAPAVPPAEGPVLGTASVEVVLQPSPADSDERCDPP